MLRRVMDGRVIEGIGMAVAVAVGAAVERAALDRDAPFVHRDEDVAVPRAVMQLSVIDHHWVLIRQDGVHKEPQLLGGDARVVEERRRARVDAALVLRAGEHVWQEDKAVVVLGDEGVVHDEPTARR